MQGGGDLESQCRGKKKGVIVAVTQQYELSLKLELERVNFMLHILDYNLKANPEHVLKRDLGLSRLQFSLYAFSHSTTLRTLRPGSWTKNTSPVLRPGGLASFSQPCSYGCRTH